MEDARFFLCAKYCMRVCEILGGTKNKHSQKKIHIKKKYIAQSRYTVLVFSIFLFLFFVCFYLLEDYKTVQTTDMQIYIAQIGKSIKHTNKAFELKKQKVNNIYIYLNKICI